MNEWKKNKNTQESLLFLATGFEFTIFSSMLLKTPSPFLSDYMRQKPVCRTRENLRLEGLLETKDVELPEKFVIFQLFILSVASTKKLGCICVCIYICVYNSIYMNLCAYFF